MKPSANRSRLRFNCNGGNRAASRLRLLAILALGLGLAGGGVWYYRVTTSRMPSSAEATAPGGTLSETTIKILAGLQSPIELRLFAPADVSTLPPALGGFVTRVERMLTEYERVAVGNLRMIQADPRADAAAKAAAGVAGVVPFRSENGEVVYLGLAVENGARVEVVAPLAPEWEAALESDVSRAIVRATAARGTAMQSVSQTPSQPAPIDPALSEELLRTFPDLATRSFAELAQVLRERALTEFKSAALEMQAKVTATQQALADAQGNNSEAAQQAALQTLQQLQAGQSEKLKEVTARLQERIAVLERLKNVPRSTAPAR